MRLNDLAVKYSSDKLYAHSYIDEFYEKEFANRKPKTLLEIGIGYKELMEPFVPEFIMHSSLKMWRDYFPECRICGVDIDNKAFLGSAEQTNGYETRYCDQSDPVYLLKIIGCIGRPDIIIDDGSHQTEHQIISAITLLPYLRKGGIYVIEDVQEPEMILNSVWFGRIYGEVLKYDKRPDDCLLVFRHD